MVAICVRAGTCTGQFVQQHASPQAEPEVLGATASPAAIGFGAFISQPRATAAASFCGRKDYFYFYFFEKTNAVVGLLLPMALLGFELTEHFPRVFSYTLSFLPYFFKN